MEIILVDDGSAQPIQLGQDGDQAIPLRVIRHPTNRGAAAARNTGVAAAQGEWIAFIDSDDEWFPAKLERQLAFAESFGKPDRLQAFVTGFEIADHFAQGTFRRTPRPVAALQDFAAGCWYCPGTTLLIRRETFLALGGFEEKLLRLEDYEFFLRFGMAGGQIRVLPETLCRIHMYEAPSTHRVEYAAEYILDKFDDTKTSNPQIYNNIAGYCHLTKASCYYKHRRYLQTAWHLARSLLFVPRTSVQLIDRFSPLDPSSDPGRVAA